MKIKKTVDVVTIVNNNENKTAVHILNEKTKDIISVNIDTKTKVLSIPKLNGQRIDSLEQRELVLKTICEHLNLYTISAAGQQTIIEFMDSLTKSEYEKVLGNFVILITCAKNKGNCIKCDGQKICNKIYPTPPFFKTLLYSQQTMTEKQLIEIITEYTEV